MPWSDSDRIRAIPSANKARKPWVLDPVLINRSESRATFAKSLLARKPAALRLNAQEFRTLGGEPELIVDGLLLYLKRLSSAFARARIEDVG